MSDGYDDLLDDAIARVNVQRAEIERMAAAGDMRHARLRLGLRDAEARMEADLDRLFKGAFWPEAGTERRARLRLWRDNGKSFSSLASLCAEMGVDLSGDDGVDAP